MEKKYSKEEKKELLTNSLRIIKEYGRVLENYNQQKNNQSVLKKESDLPKTVKYIKASFKLYIANALCGDDLTEEEFENMRTCFCYLSEFISDDEIEKFKELENTKFEELTNPETIDFDKFEKYSMLLSLTTDRFKENMDEFDDFVKKILAQINKNQ